MAVQVKITPFVVCGFRLFTQVMKYFKKQKLLKGSVCMVSEEKLYHSSQILQLGCW
jgi:hypothetical protein